jgi:RimJ/RimL family protein N-acetyltransferase
LEQALSDRNDHYALVIRQDSNPIGLAELHRTGERSGDLGLIVEDAFQGRGVGTAALQLLIRQARKQGLRFVTADVFLENVHVIAWLRRVGTASMGREHDVCHIKLDLVTAGRSSDRTQPCVA